MDQSMVSDDLRRRAARYGDLARGCEAAVAPLMLDQCARSYEADAGRQAIRALRRRRRAAAAASGRIPC